MSNKLTPESALDQCKRSFDTALNSFCASYKPRRCLIAHSGGLDSQLLLFLASQFFPRSQLLVVHVNHHLQSDADKWADFSKQQANHYHLKHLVLDVYPVDSSENSARASRYQALESVIETGDLVLFGHHADDQAETLLYRLLRGAGLKGIAGIPISRPLGKGYLFRPLMECSRDELDAAVENAQLLYITDPSNACDSYDRNFLRNQIFPRLKQRWPNLATKWQGSAELFAETDKLLNVYLENDLGKCLIAPDQFNLSAWETLPLEAKPHVLRYWFVKVLGVSLTKEAIVRFSSEVIEAGPDSEPEFKVGDVYVRRFKKSLFLVPTFQHRLNSLEVTENGCFDMGDGSLKVQNLPQGTRINIVRREGGEKCRPIGRHTKTVKKLLQETAIPPWYRSHWPLVYFDNKLIAIPNVCNCQDSWIEENQDFSVLWCPFSLSDYS